jgi:hypothetical protein
MNAISSKNAAAMRKPIKPAVGVPMLPKFVPKINDAHTNAPAAVEIR